MTKKIFLTILLLSTLFISFAENTYNSYVSAAIDVAGNEDKKGQNLKASAFYLGQFSLDNSFSARGQFLVETEEIFKNGVFQHTPAYFTIKELSSSYRFLTENVNHYISFFLGEFDSFGADSFAKKYFGATNITSPALLPKAGLDTIGIFNFNGIGFAYSAKFATPQALSLYFYYNQTEKDIEVDGELITEKSRFLNTDLRFSSVWDSVILDTDIGLTLPLKTSYIGQDGEDKDVFLLIDTAELRTGFSMLLGNNPITNLFLQFGSPSINLIDDGSDSAIDLSDMYLYMEPRFTGNFLKCNIAFFWIPQNNVTGLKFIHNPLGININFTSQPIILFEKNADFGCNISVSTPSITESITVDVQVSPYLNLYTEKGAFEIITTINPLNFKKLNKLFSTSVGYKTYLWKNP